MLSYFFEKINVKSRIFGNEAIVSIPCGASAKTIEKYSNVVKNAGISKVNFIETSLLSAFSLNLPLTESAPCFIIDLGGGTTNVAAVTKEGVIAGLSVNFGVSKISTDIIDYVAEYFSLQIGLLSAERLKNEIGSLVDNDALSTVVNGRDLKTGVPRSCSIKAMDILPAVKIYYDKIAEIANATLVKLPPEVSAEIRRSGIFVTGVGAKIYGLTNYFNEKFGMQINVHDKPEYSAVLGGGAVISDKDLIKKISLKIN
jgi:rod shape-determining protein MreB